MSEGWNVSKTTLFHLTESALWWDFPRCDKFQGRLPVMPHLRTVHRTPPVWDFRGKECFGFGHGIVYPRISDVFPAKAKFGLFGKKDECRNYLELKCYKWKQKIDKSFLTPPQKEYWRMKVPTSSNVSIPKFLFSHTNPLKTVAPKHTRPLSSEVTPSRPLKLRRSFIFFCFHFIHFPPTRKPNLFGGW